MGPVDWMDWAESGECRAAYTAEHIPTRKQTLRPALHFPPAARDSGPGWPHLEAQCYRSMDLLSEQVWRRTSVQYRLNPVDWGVACRRGVRWQSDKRQTPDRLPSQRRPRPARRCNEKNQRAMRR